MAIILIGDFVLAGDGKATPNVVMGFWQAYHIVTHKNIEQFLQGNKNACMYCTDGLVSEIVNCSQEAFLQEKKGGL